MTGSTSTHMPERIGRFRLQSMLGRGAMGVVYKGHDEVIDRPVAIKLIRADLLDSAERESYFKRFRNEAKIAGRCVHANIVGLYDSSLHENNPYLVMEYVNGVGLQQAIPRGSQRPVEEVVPIALQVLDALQYAHERGIVHRDIKPANILLTPESRLKITDFGISRLSSAEMTLTPLLIGTPSYMSPEQCMGAALDGRSDLFSLGCVLYELLAGQKPFTGSNYTDTILSIINKTQVPLSSLRDDLPPGLSEIIDCALAKRPEGRFPDADSFSRALHDVANIRTPYPPGIPPSALAAVTLDPEPDDETIVIATGSSSIASSPAGSSYTTVSTPPPDDVSPLDAPSPEVAHRTVTEIPSEPDTGVSTDAHTISTPPVIEDPPSTTPSAVDAPHPEAEADSATLWRTTAEPDPVPSPPVDPVIPVLSPIQSPEPVASSQPEPPESGEEPSTVFDEERWQRCCEWTADCLTRVLGPVAPIVVRRMAARCNSPIGLVMECAGFIRHERERSDFLRLVGNGSKEMQQVIHQGSKWRQSA